MNFLAYSIQPAAGAAGVISRVQLPAVGRAGLMHSDLFAGRLRLPASPVNQVGRSRNGLVQHRAQHRAQCRANCMSKANF